MIWILRGHLPVRLRLADPERVTLAKIAKRLGRKSVIARMVQGGRIKDHTPTVWLVGKEGRADG